jgi:hypothetical protein
LVLDMRSDPVTATRTDLLVEPTRDPDIALHR